MLPDGVFLAAVEGGCGGDCGKTKVGVRICGCCHISGIGETDAGDGGDGGVFPALVAAPGGGEAEFAEPLPSGGAQVIEPSRAGAGGGEGEVVFAVAVVGDGSGGHFKNEQSFDVSSREVRVHFRA